MGQADRNRLLDKIHVQKMARAMMGVAVAFAFDDAQGQRAALYTVGVTCQQMGTTKEAILERMSQAFDIAAEDMDAPSETTKLVVQ